MAAVYEWVRNITYYMIFITVAGNLLADSKYEKYLRFFAGMVLILLVLKPLTGSLRLDERIAYLFESITFQNESGDFQEKLWGMEDERLNQVMGTYEEAVSMDLKGMAEAADYSCKTVRVRIETDRDSPYYGHVTDIYMKVGNYREGGDGWTPGTLNSGPVEVPRTKIEVAPVKLGEGEEEWQPGAAGNGGSGPESGGSGPGSGGAGTVSGQAVDGAAGQAAGTAGQPAGAAGQPAEAEYPASSGGSQNTSLSLPADNSERVKLNGFLRKVAGYYGLETTHVQMEWEDD